MNECGRNINVTFNRYNSIMHTVLYLHEYVLSSLVLSNFCNVMMWTLPMVKQWPSMTEVTFIYQNIWNIFIVINTYWYPAVQHILGELVCNVRKYYVIEYSIVKQSCVDIALLRCPLLTNTNYITLHYQHCVYYNQTLA